MGEDPKHAHTHAQGDGEAARAGSGPRPEPVVSLPWNDFVELIRSIDVTEEAVGVRDAFIVWVEIE